MLPAGVLCHSPDVTSSVWRMRQHGVWWHSLSYSFRYGVPQFHLPATNSISVIINLQGQPSSEALYFTVIINCLTTSLAPITAFSTGFILLRRRPTVANYMT